MFYKIIKNIENKNRLSFSSEFPYVGRGNILRDGVL